MKPTKLTNFKWTFHGPMTRLLFETGVFDTIDISGCFGIGSGPSRSLSMIRAIGDFRNTPAAAVLGQITDRVQMNLQPEWQELEGSDEDGTEVFCIIEVEVE